MTTFTATATDAVTGKKATHTASFGVNRVLVGNTIPNQALQSGGYDAGLTQAQADTKFCQIVNRGLANAQHLPIRKAFWNPSDWSTTKNDLQNYAAFGTTVIFCLQPVFPGTTTENGNLATFLSTIKSFGFSAANAYVVLWQEPEGGGKLSAAQYQGMLQYYGLTVASAGFPMVCDIGTGAGPTGLTNYGNAAIAAMQAGIPLAGLAQDFYCPQYINNGATLSILSGLAAANDLPFGVFEHGCVPLNFTVAQCTAYMNYVRNFMVTWLQSYPGLPTLYYDGQSSATGAGDLTSPIGQDPSTAVPDFRIALYQQLSDELYGLS